MLNVALYSTSFDALKNSESSALGINKNQGVSLDY